MARELRSPPLRQYGTECGADWRAEGSFRFFACSDRMALQWDLRGMKRIRICVSDTPTRGSIRLSCRPGFNPRTEAAWQIERYGSVIYPALRKFLARFGSASVYLWIEEA